MYKSFEAIITELLVGHFVVSGPYRGGCSAVLRVEESLRVLQSLRILQRLRVLQSLRVLCPTRWRLHDK